MNAPADFARAMIAAGLEPGRIIADGCIHRCRAAGDSAGKKSGWYLLHMDGLVSGAFGDWRSGAQHTWRAQRDVPMTPEHARRAQAAIAAAKLQRDRERAETRMSAKRVADRKWMAARPANPAHPYLQRKGVGVHGIRQHQDLLVLPMRDEGGTLWNVQTITPNGAKRFQRGARKRGLYLSIGGPVGDVLCIAEGYATAASVHEATGYPTACAFDCGNLLPVAQALRRKYPNTKIVLCADDDRETAERIGKNPGIEAATRAAHAVGGYVATPTCIAPATGAGMPNDHDSEHCARAGG